MRELVLRGQSEGLLRPDDPDRLGLVMFAMLQGIALVINSALAGPEQLDGLVGTAMRQFVREV
ncbi:hypothetical protein [Lentzea albida]|uniref:Transcriptional repressor C-terminal n=1 Tax=Lentzea albida TaxID=65499 RepID=A0A1H9KQD6_9PSEU|nr:hypothetical protein [Lentzea albida]SER01269.1 hypothetical protein SAMN04488000_105439 [Lentzea albida]